MPNTGTKTFNWLQRVRRALDPARFVRDQRGATMLLFALALPVMIGAVGVAIDYGYASVMKTRLQGAADAAATAAAREMHVATTDKSRIQAVAESVVKANLGDAASGVKVATSTGTNPVSVRVDLSLQAKTFFAGVGGDPMLGAQAVARLVGGTPICVLGLEEKSSGAISLERNARMTGNQCAIYSNSTNPQGIKSKDAAVVKAELICSAGGKVGGKANFEPSPLTDCPKLDDPLAGRPAPFVGGCDYNNFSVSDDDGVTLSPGVYCGGLRLSDEARAKLRPGIYVIRDGPLVVTGGASLEGEYVGFYFTGAKATFHFGVKSHIDLSAPKDGDMAGLLFFEDRNNKTKQKFEIFSDDARVLLGTIYLPNGRLYIDAYRPIAQDSAYTVIIARQVELYAGPHLVLNTDYGATDVPVPDGVDNSGKVVVLSQ